MKEILNRFIRNLTILTSLLGATGFVISFFFPAAITKFWPLLLLLFAGITLTLVTLLFSASEKKFSRFSNTFMIASMVKIFLLLLVIAGYSFKFPEDAIRFSVTLLIFYLVFLGFEIYWLLKLQHSGKNN